MTPDEWASGLRYRSGYALGDDARHRLVGVNRDDRETDRRMTGLRRELLSGLVDEDERDGVDDALAGLRPRF